MQLIDIQNLNKKHPDPPGTELIRTQAHEAAASDSRLGS